MYIQEETPPDRYAGDRRKSDRNYRERGFDFAFAARSFEAPRLVVEDTRRAYGERRFVALGAVDSLVIVVGYTDRRDDEHAVERRIISARPANRKERARHAEVVPTTSPIEGD